MMYLLHAAALLTASRNNVVNEGRAAPQGLHTQVVHSQAIAIISGMLLIALVQLQATLRQACTAKHTRSHTRLA